MSLPSLPENEEYSLTEKVFEALKKGILSLEIKPREYLVIGDVAKEYGLSRTPVREAIIMLEKEGWVENDGRRGARVTTPSIKTILELIEIQGVLEGHVARRAAELFSEADIQFAEAILAEADAPIRAGDHELSRALGVKFHTFLAEKAGNQRLRAMIEQITVHVDRVRPLIWRQDKAPIEQSAQHHRQILEAIKERNPLKAAELMFHHTVWYEEDLTAALYIY
ncbi:MAG: GntR family transcriptional regulator [Chloroflexota bacterium]|nr:MAG: GntR family transcriptional regulator [Chloroflexota bacterium]